ncbi:unnamed protein product [Gongylonema pulchrum]|uniref:Uncharacterized protein n=1 Tax=Gongylonema pulchrum TaxID=637853 RepID=A0A3P6R090_9BILA|nr:unnamed protein product [Gongylonema pulchrum]
MKFFVPGGEARSSAYRVLVRAQDDVIPFEKLIPGAPDLKTLFLQTDKSVYKPMDTDLLVTHEQGTLP